MGRSQSDRGPLEHHRRGAAPSYLHRHVSISSSGRPSHSRSPSRERRSSRVFLTTPLSDRELSIVSEGLVKSAREVGATESEELRRVVSDQGRVEGEREIREIREIRTIEGPRERTRSITYGQGPRMSRERVVVQDGEGRRREYYQGGLR